MNKLQNRDGLPDAFLEEKRFFELYGPGKTDTPTGWNTPENWKYLEDIPEEKYFGFAVCNKTSYLMIDCDHVFDDSGHLVPWIGDAIQRCWKYGETYWEYSKSKKGLHLFVDLGDYADDFQPISNSYSQIIIDMNPNEYDQLQKVDKAKADTIPKIELFYLAGGRYCYLTGQHKKKYEIAKGETAAAWFHELLKLRSEYHAKHGFSGGSVVISGENGATSQTGSKYQLDEETRKRVLEGLRYIPSNTSMLDWARIGAALYNCGFPVEVFDEWSKYGGQVDENGNYIEGAAICQQYDARQIPKEWSTFSQGRTNWNEGTIIAAAHENGFEKIREYPLPPKAAESAEQNLQNIIDSIEAPTLEELFEKEIKPLEWIVQDILPTGVFLVGSPPKYFKSFMALDLCLTVCTGGRFLGFQSHKYDCVYMDLESGERRPRDRAKTILKGKLPPKNFRVVTRETFWIPDQTKRNGKKRPLIGDGFREYLEALLKKYPSVKLVVVDVFKKIRRPAKKGQDGYDRDYDDLTELEEIAEQFKICILLIHHTRKMKDPSDPFNELSGSTGLTGSVDGSWVIAKKHRNDPDAVLYTTGRDIDSLELAVKFDKASMRWTSAGTLEDILEQRKVDEYHASPITKTIMKLLEQNGGEWSGSATDIIEAAKFFGYYIQKDATWTGRQISEWQTLFEFDGITVTNGTEGRRKVYRFQRNS